MKARYAWAFSLGLLLAAAGCQSASLLPKSFPLNEENRKWLQEGEQTRITPAVRAAAKPLLAGSSRGQKIRIVMDLLHSEFTYDQAESIHAAARTADELVRGGVFGDCTDYALVAAALLRSAGVPARIVLAADAGWIGLLRRDPSAVPEGHAMLEVWGDRGPQWINPSWGNLYPARPGGGNVLPDGYFWARAGRDYWDMGIRGVEDLRNLLYETARGADREETEQASFGAPVPRN